MKSKGPQTQKEIGNSMSDQKNSVLEFVAPSLENISAVRDFLKAGSENLFSLEDNPNTMLFWRDLYNYRFALYENSLFIMTNAKQRLYLLPFSDDLEKAVNILAENTEGGLENISFLACEGQRLDEFKKVYADSFSINPSRDDFEYIYSSKDLIELKGSKYHTKRNHISFFTREFDWTYEPITKENVSDVILMAEKWKDLMNKIKKSESISAEYESTKFMLSHMDELNIKGGLIRANGNVAAFTYGSPINSRVFDIHVEKALPEYRTAYAVINREFARHCLSDYEYINREDDMGLEGLRAAKLSYHPTLLLKKYILSYKNNEAQNKNEKE